MIYVDIQLQSIVKVVTLHSFFIAALMSIGTLLSNHRNIKNQILFGLFLAFSLIIFYFFLYESKLVESHPYISALCLPGMFLLGPMLYFLTLYSINNNYIPAKKTYLHLLPATFSILIGPLSIYFYGYEHLRIFFDFFANKLILVIGLLGSFSFVFYLVIVGNKLIKSYLWNLNNLKKEPSALASFIIFDILATASITDLISLITGNYIFLQISELLLSVCVILLFLLNLIYPGFNIVIIRVIENEIQKRSNLSNIDIDTLKTKIDELIYAKEIFTNEHLSLKKAASLLGITSHQLSAFINEYFNKNFATFINEFRINKAKKLLIEKPEFTILAIAYDVGFNSKSAFNTAFRKITGLTPSEFKTNLKS